jgi:hypothetical protein
MQSTSKAGTPAVPTASEPGSVQAEAAKERKRGPRHKKKKAGALDAETNPKLAGATAEEKAILRQLEYYFSNQNLWRDRFLLNEMAKSSGKWVKLSEVVEFPKLKAMTQDMGAIIKVLRMSTKLELDDEEKCVRRVNPLPPYTKKDVKRTIYVDCLPSGSSIKSVRKAFSKFGRVLYVTKCPPLGRSGQTLERSPADANTEISTCLVEFAKGEGAALALTSIEKHNGRAVSGSPMGSPSLSASLSDPSSSPTLPPLSSPLSIPRKVKSRNNSTSGTITSSPGTFGSSRSKDRSGSMSGAKIKIPVLGLGDHASSTSSSSSSSVEKDDEDEEEEEEDDDFEDEEDEDEDGEDEEGKGTGEKKLTKEISMVPFTGLKVLTKAAYLARLEEECPSTFAFSPKASPAVGSLPSPSPPSGFSSPPTYLKHKAASNWRLPVDSPEGNQGAKRGSLTEANKQRSSEAKAIKTPEQGRARASSEAQANPFASPNLFSLRSSRTPLFTPSSLSSSHNPQASPEHAAGLWLPSATVSSPPGSAYSHASMYSSSSPRTSVDVANSSIFRAKAAVDDDKSSEGSSGSSEREMQTNKGRKGRKDSRQRTGSSSNGVTRSKTASIPIPIQVSSSATTVSVASSSPLSSSPLYLPKQHSPALTAMNPELSGASKHGQNSKRRERAGSSSGRGGAKPDGPGSGKEKDRTSSSKQDPEALHAFFASRMGGDGPRSRENSVTAPTDHHHHHHNGRRRSVGASTSPPKSDPMSDPLSASSSSSVEGGGRAAQAKGKKKEGGGKGKKNKKETEGDASHTEAAHTRRPLGRERGLSNPELPTDASGGDSHRPKFAFANRARGNSVGEKERVAKLPDDSGGFLLSATGRGRGIRRGLVVPAQDLPPAGRGGAPIPS